MLSSNSHVSSYRPEIDGLRAIAILTVVFYHVGLGCPGGYIGVDIFFVISGYLISSLILRDLREGTFSLARFWERRVRRIFPALAACVMATLVAGWFLLLPEDLVNLGKATVAQTILAANFYFWRTTNYFASANEAKPLLHTWSLAVEEQFYLLFPLLLLACFRSPALRRPRTLVTLILLGLVGSLSIAVWGVKHQPYATFFLLPTRAWELLCGVLVAALPVSAIPTSRFVRESASWLGIGAILLPVWLYGETTPFPGLAALPPCLGTALVIWGTGRRSETWDTLASRVLSIRPVVFIGLISYSLYLWHWPLIAFCSYWKTAPFSSPFRWGLVGISIVLAVLSWRFVETPFRRKQLCDSRRKVFAFAAWISGLSLVSGAYLVYTHGLPARMPRFALDILQAVKDDAKTRKQYKLGDVKSIGVIESDELPRFGHSSRGKPLDIIILGDSHAWCAIPVFDRLGRKYELTGTSIVHRSTPPLLEWKHDLRFGAKEPDKIWQAAVQYIKENQVRHTFLVANWSSYQAIAGQAALRISMETTIQKLHESGTKVWVILDAPTYKFDVVKSLVRNSIYPAFTTTFQRQTQSQHYISNQAIYKVASSSKLATFLDPSLNILDSDTLTYQVLVGNSPLYFDSHHLTSVGAETCIAPVIESAMASIKATPK